jgi:tetraacyldisaccharide-1-P 4'-kinase
MLSKVDQTTNAAGLEKTIQKHNPRAPIFNASLQAQAFRSTANDETLSLAALQGQRAVAVCSIGDPASFFSLLESLGVTITARLAFPDHHWYDEADYRVINQSGGNANFIITTEKDIAKLDETMLGKRKILALQTRMQVAGEEQFFKTIRACVAELITTEQR